MRINLLILLLLLSLTAFAQEESSLKQILENLNLELPEDLDFIDTEQHLEYIKRKPIHINSNPKQLLDLFFVSPLHVQNLIEYINKYGKIIDLNEIQAVPGYSIEFINLLKPYISIEQTTHLSVKQLNQTILSRYTQILETQKGFLKTTGSRYLGSAPKILLKYTFDNDNNFKGSILIEKDAGEHFISPNKKKIFDFLSLSATLTPNKLVNNFVIGDYTLQFGQALTLWSGFSFGKGIDVASNAKVGTGLKNYSSSNEHSFFRGLATTLKLTNHYSATLFASHRNFDASLSPNNLGVLEFSTINQTGLHRTETELKNSSSLGVNSFGIINQFTNQNTTLDLIAYRTIFNHAATTGTNLYKEFSLNGKELTNIGISYAKSYKNLYLFGEVSKSYPGKSALINGVLISLSKEISLSVLHRFYDPQHHNFWSQAIAESTTTANESGFFSGLNIQPIKQISISYYTDYFKFPWLKYRVDAPSSGVESMLQVSYTPNKFTKLFFKYKKEIKEQNSLEPMPINYLDAVFKSNYTLTANYKIKFLKVKNGIQLTTYKKGNEPPEQGYLIFQDIDFGKILKRLNIHTKLAYFNTKSYNSRIYGYENDVLYSFTYGMYYGKGIRSNLNLKYTINKKADCWFRYSCSYLPHNENIGSGLDEIEGNKKQEVKFQIRIKF